MQTENYVFSISREMNLTYPYYADNKPSITIFATPVFDIPLIVRCTLDNSIRTEETGFNVHSHIIPFPYLLFFSSLFTVMSRRYSKVRYSLSFLPLLLFAVVLLYLIK